MKTLRVLVPWGLIICGLINRIHSLPAPALESNVAESVCRDVKGDETSTLGEEDGWQQVISKSSRKKQNKLVKNTTPIEIRETPRREHQNFVEGAEQNTTPKEIEEKPRREYENFVEGAEQNTIPWKDLSSTSDQLSQTNPMIHMNFTPTQEDLVNVIKARGILLRRRRKRERKAAHREIAKNPHPEGEKFLEGAEQDTLQKLVSTPNEIMEQESTGLRLRRKNPRRMQKVPVSEIEDSPPEDVEEEIPEQHPVAAAFKKILIYYLLAYQSLMGVPFGTKVAPHGGGRGLGSM